MTLYTKKRREIIKKSIIGEFKVISDQTKEFHDISLSILNDATDFNLTLIESAVISIFGKLLAIRNCINLIKEKTTARNQNEESN